MNAQEKLTAQKNELHVQQANDIVDRLLGEANRSINSAQVVVHFLSSDSYINPCPNLQKPARCGLSYCLDCHFIRTGKRVTNLDTNRFFVYPLRAMFFLNNKPCHDIGTCRADRNTCFERHAFPNFDPARLSGIAKCVYEKLNENGFTINIDKADKGFNFVLSW